MSRPKQSPLGRATDAIEESLIAFIIGAMTVITFANVVARYGFNSNIIWALEATVFLFAWMVLLGASYCVKTKSHLGVDAVVNLFPPRGRKVLTLLAGGMCILYALLLLKGSYDYWAPFVELPVTSGRIIPTGFEDVRGQGWYEVEDIKMPAWLNPFFSEWFNAGEDYEKIPRLIPYTVMPLSMGLLLFRYVQATWGVYTGTVESLIASHEAEELVEEAAKNADKEG